MRNGGNKMGLGNIQFFKGGNIFQHDYHPGFLIGLPEFNDLLGKIIFLAVKHNFKRNIVVISAFLGLLVYFLWSISVFAMNLNQFVSYKWIINTSISIFISMVITPFIKPLLMALFVDWIIEKYKMRIKRKNVKSNKVSPSEEGIKMYQGDN